MKKNEVTIFLQGGLGNQLFQFTFGEYLRKNKKYIVHYSTLLLDLMIPGVTKRKFELTSLINSDEIVGSSRSLFYLTKSKFQKKYLATDENYLYLEKIKFAFGYFHNYSIVEDCWDSIKLKMLRSPQFSELITKSFSEEYIGIHVRKGDYISSKRARELHGVLPIEYFINSIKLAKKIKNLNRVKIVSDSVKEVSDLVNYLVTNNFEVQVASSNLFDDLKVLINSSILILSNSTFSWWAGYLASRLYRVDIFIPEPWLISQNDRVINLIPQNWSKVTRFK